MAEENDRIAEWVGATDGMMYTCEGSACSHWQRVDVGSTIVELGIVESVRHVCNGKAVRAGVVDL